MIYGKAFEGWDIAVIPIDTEYQRCSFRQEAPIDDGQGGKKGHRLFPGDDTPRTFINCHLMNCEVPPGSTIVDSNTTLAEQVIGAVADETIVDGVVVHRTREAVMRIYGRYNPDTLDIELHPTAIDSPVAPIEEEL